VIASDVWINESGAYGKTVTVCYSGFLPCLLAWRRPFFRDSRGKRAPVHFYRYFLLFFSLSLPCAAGAEQAVPSNAMEYQIKAAFLYKFCLYTEWPAAAFPRAESPFVFGVLGSDSFLAELNTVVNNRTIGNRPVQVRNIADEKDLAGVQVVFVARTHMRLLSTLTVAAISMPLLIVTESEGSLGNGATINFTLQNNRVSFEVALDNAQQHGLHLSAKMLEVASNVHLKSNP
jgi:hypothetical protein